MADGKEKKKRLRLPRKAVFVASGGILLLLTATAAATYVMGGIDSFLDGGADIYGLDCRLVETVAFDEGEHARWVRTYVAVAGSDGMARVRTGLRVARAAAAAGHADLVLVVVLDADGPKQRPKMRDNAVGARVIYAPNPARIAGMSVPYSVTYRKGTAAGSGAFYGDAVDLPPADIDALVAKMKKPYGCKEPQAAETADASAHGENNNDHAVRKPAHGETKAHH